MRDTSHTDSTASMAAEKESHNRIPAAVSVACFCSALGIGLFSFTLPLVSWDEKVSGAWLGSVFAVYFAAKLAVAPLAGIWADRSGPVRPMLCAALIGAAAPLIYLIHSSLAVLYAVQIALGLAGGLMRPAGFAALGRAVPESARALWFGRCAAVFNAAFFFGPLAGGILYLNRDMLPVAVGVSLCMLAAGAAIFFIADRPEPVSGQVSDSGHIPENDVSPADAVSSGKASRWATTVPLFLAVCGRSLGIGAMTAFYPLVLATRLGLSGPLLGLVFSAGNLAAFIGLPLLGRIQNRKNDRMWAAGGMLLSAAALFCLGRVEDPMSFMVVGCVAGFGTACSLPASMNLTARISPRQGKMFGSAQAVSALGFLLGPMLGGAVVAISHDSGPVLEAAGLIGIVCSLPLLMTALKRLPGWSRAYTVTAASTAFLGLMLTFSISSLMPSLGDCHARDSLYRFSGTAMGTIVRLTFEAENKQQAEDASRKVFSLIRSLQSDLDHRNPNGSVGRINHAAGDKFVRPSQRAYLLIARALEFSRRTGGVFDLTIGAVSDSPLYYVLNRKPSPSDSGLVDYRQVRMRPDDRTVKLGRKGMALDLGGMAKGMVIDECTAALRSMGITAGMVEAGGDFYCFGDRDWRVGIRDPRGSGTVGTVFVRNKGVCGSGDYQRFVMWGGEQGNERRHHIIDPQTMRSADRSTGVTVIAENAELADALATALFIMGPDQGKIWLKRHYPHAAAQWIDASGRIIDSSEFHFKHSS